MKDNKRKPASMTIPFCMSLVVMAALIFCLVEGARYHGLKGTARDLTNLAVESLFAGYQKTLLEEYRMFFLDGTFGGDSFDITAAEDKMTALLYENFMVSKKDGGINLYRMDTVNTEVNGYMLATDANGKVFEMQAANIMKKFLARHAAERILEKIEDVKNKKTGAPDPKEAIADAEKAFEELSAEGRKKESESEAAEPKTDVKENPLDTMSKLQKKGILALVFPNEKRISKKNVSTDQGLTKRSLKKGTYKNIKKSGWYERILMQEFVKPLLGNVLSPKEDGKLSYGTEYLICGRGSDEGNLKKAAEKLLILRESMNFLYLQTDEKKKAEALAAATAFAAASANPVIISAVKQGILAAWAYVESICDVKALFLGKKVPLMKDAASWKSSLINLGGAVDTDYEKDTKGLSYEDYLDVLLYEKTVRQIAYRSMDLMEWSIQEESGQKNCKMDHMIAGLKLTAEYDANTLFLDIFAEDKILGYRFLEKAEYVYGQK